MATQQLANRRIDVVLPTSYFSDRKWDRWSRLGNYLQYRQVHLHGALRSPHTLHHRTIASARIGSRIPPSVNQSINQSNKHTGSLWHSLAGNLLTMQRTSQPFLKVAACQLKITTTQTMTQTQTWMRTTMIKTATSRQRSYRPLLSAYRRCFSGERS
jgi:hypothetical protein